MVGLCTWKLARESWVSANTKDSYVSLLTRQYTKIKLEKEANLRVALN